MAKAFGITSKKKIKDEDYEFPMQIPYIAKMQDKDNSLMKELIKSNHKYELTSNGNKKLRHRMVSSITLSSWRYAHRSNNRTLLLKDL
jgi:hypothetical protein